jgi:hypothetical protein
MPQVLAEKLHAQLTLADNNFAAQRRPLASKG